MERLSIYNQSKFYEKIAGTPVLENLYQGNFFSKWGFTDYFDEEALKNALDTKDTFDTGDLECQTNSYSSRILKCKDCIYVIANAWMCEGYELLELALEDVSCELPPDYESDELFMQNLFELIEGIDTEISFYDTLPLTATYKEIIEAIDKCGNACNNVLTVNFNEIVDSINEYVTE